MPTIGLKTSELPFRPHSPAGPLKLLFVGNVITLKGIDLALEAYQKSGIDGTFTLVGAGNYESAARAQALRLGLAERVIFRGRLPRAEVLTLYTDYDLFVFPSLHDTGGYAVIEAMLNELPVVCLDCGGPAVAVRENCGVRVPLGPRAKVIEDLAAALRGYDRDRARLAEHGRNARASVLQNYDWDRKGEEMNRCYEAALNRARSRHGEPAAWAGYSGMGGLTNFLHRIFSVRGVAVAVAGLSLIALAGFLSLSHLKRLAEGIVNDTLPGLSYAGEANAHLAQGYNHSLMLLLTDSPDERRRLRATIEADHQVTSRFLQNYKGQIFSEEDERLFANMMSSRADYVRARERMFALAEANEKSNAVAFCRAELMPAYERYKEAGNRLFVYNMRQGERRSEIIMRVCTITQFVIAGLGVMVFAVGFLIGFFK